MTTIQLNEDKNRVQEFLDLAKKLHFNFKIIDDSIASNKKQKSKWANVANEMSGTMSSDTARYMQECSKEFREGFELREYK
ncbi:MAG: hypothetical protein ACQERK_06645 [Campylobacterota bacterium]